MASYNKDDPSSIQKMFDNIARNYDRTNSILSFYLHRRWNHQLVKQVLQNKENAQIVDLCSGTGDIAKDYLHTTSHNCNITLVDFSANMLAIAKDKLNQKKYRHHISYLQADAQDLPIENRSVHAVTMAYGIRNIKDPAQSMREVYRILKPGGVFGILELTKPRNLFLKLAHTLYLRLILPSLGKYLTSDEEAYHYLQRSIRNFIPPLELEHMMQDSHFINTKRISLAGGIATIIVGYKGEPK